MHCMYINVVGLNCIGVSMVESVLLNKEVVVIFKDGDKTRTFRGILVEILDSYITIFTEGKNEMIPNNVNLVRIGEVKSEVKK